MRIGGQAKLWHAAVCVDLPQLYLIGPQRARREVLLELAEVLVGLRQLFRGQLLAVAHARDLGALALQVLLERFEARAPLARPAARHDGRHHHHSLCGTTTPQPPAASPPGAPPITTRRSEPEPGEHLRLITVEEHQGRERTPFLGGRRATSAAAGTTPPAGSLRPASKSYTATTTTLSCGGTIDAVKTK